MYLYHMYLSLLKTYMGKENLFNIKLLTNDYFWKWIDILHSCLQFLFNMGDRAQIFQAIPPVFIKSKFSRLTSIIDYFENICGIFKKFTCSSTMLQPI